MRVDARASAASAGRRGGPKHVRGRRRAAGRAILAACAASLILPAVALADTLRVSNENESGPGSLGGTILEAGLGDTIEIPAGQYPLTHGDTLIEQGNTLVGAGESRTTIVPTGGGEALDEVTVDAASIAPALNPAAGDAGLETKVQVVALIATLAIFLLVFELVRRRRLAERYALLWLSAAVVLLALAVWRGALDVLADAMGIADPANAIFILAIGAAFILLLHFSVATSRLSEETKILAQEIARLDYELRLARGEIPGENGSTVASAEQGEHQRPVGTQGGG